MPRNLAAPTTAAVAGLLLLASHPPVGWWPLSFAAPGLLVVALWLDAAVDQANGRGPRGAVRGFRLGALAGAAAFAPMLGWLILPAGYVGWGLLVAVQVLWFGLLGTLVAVFLDRWWLPFAAAAVWTGIDAWRGTFPLNGFEWGAIAYAHVDGSWLLPLARILGGRGITFLVVLISVAAAMAAMATLRAVRDRDGGRVEQALGGTRRPLVIFVGALLVSVLATVEPPAEDGTLDVLAVQGNDVRHWEDDTPDPDPPLRIATALRDETLAAVDRDGVPDLTVWPESSLDRDPHSARGEQLGERADETAEVVGVLLSGVTLDGPEPAENRYVAASVYEGGLNEVDRYVKRRLVPFGEYIPARDLLDWFPPLEQIPRDALSADEPHNVEVADGVKAAVIICFETKFSDVVAENILADDDPAQIVITVTNDASFGDSAEPAQHLAQSQLRAVETGRWVVHAALTGSSAFVDPDGGTHQDTDLFTVDSIRSSVPLVAGLTPYLVVGDVVGWIGRIAVVVALVVGVIDWRRRDRPAASRAGRDANDAVGGSDGTGAGSSGDGRGPNDEARGSIPHGADR